MKPITVIGIGNLYAGDDGVGILAARRLKAHQLEGVDIIEGGIIGLNLLNVLDGVEFAILIDAVQSGQKSGTIHRLEIPPDLGKVRQLMWNSRAASTHDLGLGEALALGAELKVLPEKLIVYGIEWGQIPQGMSVTAPVSEALGIVIGRILREIESLTCTNSM